MAAPPEEGLPKTVRVKSVFAVSILFNEVGPAVWGDYMPEALEKGKLIPKPDPLIAGKGLESIQKGIDRQRSGVSAHKVVVTDISS